MDSDVRMLILRTYTEDSIEHVGIEKPQPENERIGQSKIIV